MPDTDEALSSLFSYNSRSEREVAFNPHVYHSYEEQYQYLEDAASEFPRLVTKWEIGRTAQVLLKVVPTSIITFIHRIAPSCWCVLAKCL